MSKNQFCLLEQKLLKYFYNVDIVLLWLLWVLHTSLLLKMTVKMLGNVFFRRIAYQESSQTFGVISMRMDLQDSNGLNPTRPSASTHAAMTSSSSSGKVTMGTSTMGEHSTGDEVEVHSLLIIDQHTFEGIHSFTDGSTGRCM